MLKNYNTVGLTSFQIKIIAVICMTIDHIAAYGTDIPVISNYYVYFRIIGRIAAPLFLFVLVQSVRYTRSKPKFIARLYIAGVLTGLFQVVTNFLLGNVFGIFSSDNIIFNFFYIALYIYLIEKLLDAMKIKSLYQVLKYIGIIVVSATPYFLYNFINDAIPRNWDFRYAALVQGLRDSFFPSFYNVGYGYPFMIIGIILYFAKTKKRQCITFFVFCIICLAGALISYQNILDFSHIGFAPIYFDFRQCLMILAVPFMMLFNGQRGLGNKLFFYVYYPTHRYLITVISVILKQS